MANKIVEWVPRYGKSGGKKQRTKKGWKLKCNECGYGLKGWSFEHHIAESHKEVLSMAALAGLEVNELKLKTGGYE